MTEVVIAVAVAAVAFGWAGLKYFSAENRRSRQTRGVDLDRTILAILLVVVLIALLAWKLNIYGR